MFDAATHVKREDRQKALRAVLWPEIAPADAAAAAAAAAYTKAKKKQGRRAGPKPPPAPEPPEALAKAISTVGLVGAAFRASFVKGTSGKRVGAKSEGTPGTVAAHGFMNLPPVLVGALSGSDAGNLQWLGTSSVHDYMHFQLRTPPPLNIVDPPSADARHGPD